MLNLYPLLVDAFPQRVHQIQKPYTALTERHLQIIWLEQKWIKSLRTVQGEKIEVISSGIWNQEAGPDFLKAHLRIGSCEYRGDIEIHLYDEGWYHHHHHDDPRYNHVILHVSFFRPLQSSRINKENGQPVLLSYLNESLCLPLPQLLSEIDFDFYPSKQFYNRGRCASHLFHLLPEIKVKHLFQSAAYWRLEKKLNALERVYSDRSLQFAAGIAMALGYKHNAQAFSELFNFLLAYRDLSYLQLLSIALGCCGFLEEGRKKSWETSSYYQELRLLWWEKRDQITHQTHLKLDRIRPLNHPMRRLAYLTHLLQDACLEKLWELTLETWQAAIHQPKIVFRKLKEDFFQLIPSYQDAYWDYHYTFETQARSKYLSSLGEELKTHFLLNTTLPLLYLVVKEAGDLKQWQLFQEFYASLEIAETSKSRYLNHRFFEKGKNDQFFTNAQMAQGAYQLHQDFCVHFESSCEGCPFVDRYHQQQ